MGFDEAWAGGEVGVDESSAKACGLGEGGDCFGLGGSTFGEKDWGKGEGLGEEATNELESIGPAVECEEGIVADFGFGLGDLLWREIGQVGGD